jgi:hypothetical protein
MLEAGLIAFSIVIASAAVLAVRGRERRLRGLIEGGDVAGLARAARGAAMAGGAAAGRAREEAMAAALGRMLDPLGAAELVQLGEAALASGDGFAPVVFAEVYARLEALQRLEQARAARRAAWPALREAFAQRRPER